MKSLRKFPALILLLFFSTFVYASATRTIDADAVRSSDATKTYTMPGAAGTVMVSVGFVQEIPSGSCNGSNTAFTLANTPTSVSTVVLQQDGLVLTQGSGKDYTISGASITLAVACGSGQSLWAVYSKY